MAPTGLGRVTGWSGCYKDAATELSVGLDDDIDQGAGWTANQVDRVDAPIAPASCPRPVGGAPLMRTVRRRNARDDFNGRRSNAVTMRKLACALVLGVFGPSCLLNWG